jgi:hypothetical protein
VLFLFLFSGLLRVARKDNQEVHAKIEKLTFLKLEDDIFFNCYK